VDNAKLYKSQKMKYFLVIDQGTSSTRAILFDEKFAVVNVSQTEFKQFFPKDGWVEHDANEIFDTVLDCIKDVMRNPKQLIKKS
jgi:glycerol kinase